MARFIRASNRGGQRYMPSGSEDGRKEHAAGVTHTHVAQTDTELSDPELFDSDVTV